MTDLSRPEIDAMLDASEARLAARLAHFDASIKTGFAELRADMAKMQIDAHKNTADLFKWGIGFAIAIVGSTVGLITFINKANEKPVLAPAPIQPIIIYTQPTPPGETPNWKSTPPTK
jgi:hypothetical protein